MRTKLSTILLFIYLSITSSLYAATITSTTAGGDWAVGATWVGGVAPATTDAAVIATTGAGVVTTLSGTITCAGLTINSGATLTMKRPLIVNGATSVTGTFNFGSTSTTNLMTFNGDITLNSGAIWTETATSAIPTFTFSNNFVNNSTTFTALTGIHTFSGTAMSFSGTNTTSIANISITGTYTNNGTLTAATTLIGTGNLTNGATGTLNIGGTSTISTLTATAGGNTVKYTGSSQTGIITTYNHLTLAGSGTKTFATTPTVNGTLSIEGTANITVTTGVVTYGTNATLSYNTATSRIASSEEWITPFTSTGGVIIANTGTITMNTAKVFDPSIPLTINSGATLSLSSFLLTLNGNLVNNGGTVTGTTGGVTITGTANQSIGALTTTGTVSMTKTSGTATLTGNINGAGLSITTACTINLGTALTHTFTGTWTQSAGTLVGGTSTLILNSTTNITGGTFTASTGTVNYNAAGNQTIPNLAYYNLNVSNSGTKSLSAGTTITGGVSISGTSILSLGTFNSTAATLSLGGNGQTNGTWGGTISVASNKNSTYFASTTGILTIATPLVTPGYWTGITSTDWNTASNWQGGSVPTAATDVAILSGGNQPNINSSAACNNIYLNAGATLTISGSNSLTVSGNWYHNGTFNPNASTVTYNGTAQTCAATTYNNLTLSTSGLKTFATTPTINGKLSMEGTATISIAPTYGASATLQYNTSTLRTAGAEWISNFAGTGGIIIANTGAITMNAAKTLGTSVPLTINAGSILSTGSISTSTLTVGGVTTINGRLLLANSAAKVFTGNVSVNAGGEWSETAGSTYSFGGNLLNQGALFTASTGIHTFSGTGVTISGATTTSIPNIAITGTCSNNNTLTIGTALSGTGSMTNAATGILSIGATCTITTLTASAAGNTVRYTGGAQTGIVTTYSNLTLAGSGLKTFITSPTVNLLLTMEGTATISTAPFYDTTASLKYNTATSKTVGAEWISPFMATGGVTIASTGAITLDAAKVFGSSVPLIINSGASMNTKSGSNFGLSFGGDFIKNGTLTANASPITIVGTMTTQSISGFTTSGAVAMTKTAGTATLTGAVSGAAFTMDGSGGTLNLGNGLTHTFSGTWTRTNGTLNGGSSTLKLGGSVTGTGGTFTANTGTVNYYANAPQTLGLLTYNNLTISGTSSKTFPAGTITVNGVLSREGSASTTVTGTLTYGASSTLQYKGSGTQTTGSEFVTPFPGSGGVKIENTFGVTLNAAKSLGTNPLTIGSFAANSIFKDGGFQLTATGTLNLTSGTLKLGAGTTTSFPAFSTINIAAGTTVEYASTAATTQTVKGLTYSNLTISGTGTRSKIADANTTVNGILTLNSTNFSATQGCLDMAAYTLTMGTSATTGGTGDVTGIITRNNFVANTPYSFGNQYTTISLTADGTLPSSMSVKTILSATHAFKTNAINRYYDIIQTGGNSATKVTLNLHYLTSELNGAIEGNLDLFDYIVGAPSPTDNGYSNTNTTNKWVGLTNLSLTNVASSNSFGAKYWILGTSAANTTWTGVSSTDWTSPTNWSGNVVPTSGIHAIIPDAGTTTYDPTLPPTATLGYMSIQAGGILNGGTGTTLTIDGAASAWDNNGTFNAGTSTITYSNAAATLSGSTDFNNVTVANAATLTLGTGTVMRISGTFTLTGTGVLNATTNANTIEYNGGSQTVVAPNGTTPGFSSLTLSGSGTKTLPATALSILNDFTTSGTISATAGNVLTITGDVTLGSGTTFNAATFTHNIAGNWINNGATFTPGSSTINFNNNSSVQEINGTASSQTFNRITIAKTAQTLTISGNTSTISLNGAMTISSGIFDIGTALNLNVAGNWSNSGSFTAGSGTLSFNGASPQTLGGVNTFNNLTINNSTGITASANQTVNGTLYLQSTNASGTQGTLEMGVNTLNLGSNAVTTGDGDVTGWVNRSYFDVNTLYTFGSQYTIMSVAASGALPTSMSFKTTLANPAWKTNAVNRIYEITQTGFDANTRITVNLHYLDSELNGTTEGNLDLFDNHIADVQIHNHGHSNYNTTNNWVGLTNLGLQFVSTGGDHLWTIGTNNSSDNCTWIGGNSAGATEWNLPENWNGGLPTGTSHVIIPNVTYDPILPDSVTIGSLSIQAGGLLTDDLGNTLTIAGGNGAWDNLGTFVPGSGTIVFTNTDATMSGTTNFNNLTVVDGAALTLQEDNTMRITGNLTIAGAGILNANEHKNTVEYNGTDQTIAFPNSATGSYYNLVLSGSGVKTMPGSPLGIGMDLTLSGTVSVTAAQDINITRNMTISTGTSFNGGSYTLSTGGNWVNNGTFNANTGTVDFKGTSAQTITGTNTFNNLTISKSGGVTANANITVNGILNLAVANPSATKGLLEMTRNYGSYPGTTITDYLDSYLLNMGESATTIGIGDVTGTIKRTSISANIPYTFGNQFTMLSLTTGVMPSALTVTTTIGTTPPSSIDKVRDAIKRTYEIVATGGSGSNVTANFHYLDSELTSSISPNYVNTDLKLTTIDFDIDAGNHGSAISEEHGRANFDYTNKYIGFSSMPISYFIQVPTTHEYRSIITLRDFSTNHYTWSGTESTDWANSLNWSPVGVPGTGTNVVIPDAGTTAFDPALSAGSTTVNTITIENGGILTMGSNTLITESTMGAGWEDQNPLGNDPGTGKVIFSNPGATIAGTARFYDIEIANGADVTNQLNSYIQIGHAVTKTGTGKWYANAFNNTVDYNGGAQTIAIPDDTYKNLVLSGGSVIKSLPSSAFIISGGLTLTGSVTANLDGEMTLVGGLNIGNGTTLNTGTTNHYISGDITCNGTFAPSTGTITMNGTSAQSILGTEATTTFHNLTVNNATGVSIDKIVSTANLNINNGKKLSISPTKGLTVTTGIVNQAGVDGLVIKASKTAANGTLIFAGTAPLATVEMYSVASWNLAAAAGSKYKWQFFGIPTSGVAASPFFDGTYVRRYNEPTGTWIQLKNGDNIDPFTGYEITQSGNMTYAHTGTLVNANNTIALSYTGAAAYPGQHILSNPYAAAIDINQLIFDPAHTDEAVYLYNTGTLQEWAANGNGNSDGTNPGQYTAVSKGSAGTLLIPREIPSMQGFLVKATDAAGGSITINYNTVKKLNTELQRAPAAEKVAMRIDLKGKKFGDRMWIFSDPTCTRGFDNGWDGEKFLGSSLTPQLYATEASGDYQIDAVDNINNTELAFQAGVDPDYTLTFTHQNMESKYPTLYLVDLLNNNLTTDISQSGSTYTFTAVQTGSPSKRFKIITSQDTVTSQNETVNAEQYTVFYSGKTLFIQNKSNETGSFYLYDMAGRIVQKIPFGCNEVKSTTLNLPAGSYILKGQTKNQSISKSIIL